MNATAMQMQVVYTSALPIERQIKAKKIEIDGYARLIQQRDKWLADAENFDKSNYRSVINSRNQLQMYLEEAKYELSQLERL